ncbi:unnamed protein product [Microthlaspi erraticum]|uniref:Uncharacterized protein n=1 Tax=Microthlaspi erraticum TaxID=1685480 RepID=A0A6D2J458_9BRAS|nr:unnamed protein product [Microthlaspi erraticum]
MIHFATQIQFDDKDLLYRNKGKGKKQRARESFRSFVDTTLLSRNLNNTLKKLSLTCEDDVDHFKTHTNRWITDALEGGVSDLDLRITMLSGERLQARLLPSTVLKPV